MKQGRETLGEAGLRSGRAALGLAAALLFVALPELPPGTVECDHPYEAVAQDARSVEVACDDVQRPNAALRGPARLLFGQRLDLNRASARSLEVLPRIGPRRAAAIVAARAERPFRTLNDVQRVSGIGPRTVEALAVWAEVESRGPTAD